MADQLKDATPMWDIMSPKDDRAVMEKFVEESKQVISKWSLGNASFVEKDAAVSFLVQLGAVQITIQSDTQQEDSQKRVSIQFGHELHSKTEAECCSAEQVETKDAVPISRNSVREDTLSQDQDIKENKEAQIDDNDDDDNNYYSAWITEPDDEDDNDEMEISDKTPVVTCQQPKEEHPCPDCHVILNSTWDLDLHRLHDCAKSVNSIQYVYNCDICLKSFTKRLCAVTHLRNTHNMAPSEVVEKLAQMKDTQKQMGVLRKERKFGSQHVVGQLKQSGKKSRRRKARNWYSEKYSHLLSKTPRIKLQRLANGWMKVLENEAIDVSKFVPNRPAVAAAVSNVEGSSTVHTPDDHQDLNCKAGNDDRNPVHEEESLDIKGREASADVPKQRAVEEDIGASLSALNSNEPPDQGYAAEQVEGKHEKYTVPRGPEAVKENTDRETSATMPLSQNSENEVEESSSNIEVFKTDECQDLGYTSRQIEEDNQDPSTDPHMEKERQRADPDESTCEPIEMTENKNLHEISDSRECKNSATSTKSTKNGKNAKTCPFCDLKLETSYKRKKHIREVHKECGDQDYKCSTCGKSFMHKSVYRAHVEIHLNREERKQYHCKICDKTYVSKYIYKDHVKLHDNQFKQFTCNTCGKALASRIGLEKHVNSVHKKEFRFTCEICGKQFSTAYGARFHMDSQHEKERPFKCDKCGKGFVREYQLRSHLQKVHSNAECCLCDICGSAFKYKSSLKQHHLTAHTDVFKYSCDVCGKKFKRTSLLNAHVKIHSSDPSNRPFKCDICSKGFRDNIKLKVHMNWHYNIRSHTCFVCGKSFLTKGNLDKHLYTHEKRKPHECSICYRGFVDLPGLRKHLDIVHKTNLKMVVTKGVDEVRGVGGTKGLESDVTVHKPAVRSPSTTTSESNDNDGDNSKHGEAEHQESFSSSSVAQMPDTSDGQVVREALLAMMNA